MTDYLSVSSYTRRWSGWRKIQSTDHTVENICRVETTLTFTGTPAYEAQEGERADQLELLLRGRRERRTELAP
jgi:hypothetical protein